MSVVLEGTFTVDLRAGVAVPLVAVADLGAAVGALSQAERNVSVKTKTTIRAKTL